MARRDQSVLASPDQRRFPLIHEQTRARAAASEPPCPLPRGCARPGVPNSAAGGRPPSVQFALFNLVPSLRPRVSYAARARGSARRITIAQTATPETSEVSVWRSAGSSPQPILRSTPAARGRSAPGNKMLRPLKVVGMSGQLNSDRVSR